MTRSIKQTIEAALIIGTLGVATIAGAMAQTASPKKLTAGILWHQILPRHLTYIQDGHHGPIIYDFQDPNCPYCHALYENEVPLIKAGKLTVRYVPVAFLTPSSPEEAADWLLSPDPLKTLNQFETIVGKAFRSGSYRYLPKEKPSKKILKELKENYYMMDALGFSGTPAVLYRVKDGQLGRIPGLMSKRQLAVLLPKLQ